jgi:hypothetical protein
MQTGIFLCEHGIQRINQEHLQARREIFVIAYYIIIPSRPGRTDPLIAPIGGNVNKYLPLFLSLLIRN